MRKACQAIWIRFLAIVLTAAILAPTCAAPALAWSEPPKANAVNVFIGDVEMIHADESIQIDLEGESYTIPASLLYGETAYFPQAVFQEWGIEAALDPEAELISVEFAGSLNTGEPSTFVYVQEPAPAITEADFQTNRFVIQVNGETLAEKDQSLADYDDDLPSSVLFAERVLYLPAQPVFQALHIETAWEEESSAFLISDAPAEKQNIGLSNFQKTNDYSLGQFADVPRSAWYAGSVRAAFEYGLMNGTGGTSFSPGGNMSVAETITIASRLHSVYYNDSYVFEAGSPWYQAYIDYALDNQIIAKPYRNYMEPVSRSEFAAIVGNAFPLPPINEVEDGAIPDVSEKSRYYDAVYRLYRAGILSGIDSIGTFAPDADISRAEAATILCSMVNESQRKSFTLKKPIYPDSIQLKPASVLIPVGSTHTLFATILPDNADTGIALTWSTSDPTVATVSGSGVVSGISPGTAVITLTTANGKSASCEVSVGAVEDVDILFARDAVSRLSKQLKFPDTLQIHGIWAYNYYSNEKQESKMVIWVYYSALTPLGQRRRGELQAFYNLGAMTFIVADTEDSLSNHSALHRTVNINKVFGL